MASKKIKKGKVKNNLEKSSTQKLVIITGTPGTGKSTLAAQFEKKGYFRLDLHVHYKEISTGYDRSKRCYVIDPRKFEALVKKVSKEHLKVVIDSHISHLLSASMVDLCIVMVCPDLAVLKRRLEKRGYHKAKVRENLDCEIFQVCLEEARERGHKIKIVKT
ncbi:AAA family ATPase [Candidatus Woesearchaeota archaeon]|nr:AAA family ATPase [Candidatus Woesearchaeota archaeon]